MLCPCLFRVLQNRATLNGILFTGEDLGTGKSCDNYQGYCSGDSPPV